MRFVYILLFISYAVMGSLAWDIENERYYSANTTIEYDHRAYAHLYEHVYKTVRLLYDSCYAFPDFDERAWRIVLDYLRASPHTTEAALLLHDLEEIGFPKDERWMRI